MNKYGCKNMNVVISGGTSGIGLAAAEIMAADGAQVYLLGRSEIKGNAAVEQILKKTGRQVHFISCNVADENECNNALAAVNRKIDIAITSAGIYKEERLENITAESYDEIFSVNVKGTMNVIKSALQYMQGNGSVVTVASDAGISGNYGCPVYCASKGAVVALTRALALDLAPGIRVNCICPADVDTPLVQKQLEECNGGYTLADMAEAYPLLRIGKAYEIAHVICSVASPFNSFMTGSIIPVDGGLTAK